MKEKIRQMVLSIIAYIIVGVLLIALGAPEVTIKGILIGMIVVFVGYFVFGYFPDD